MHCSRKEAIWDPQKVWGKRVLPDGLDDRCPDRDGGGGGVGELC